MSKNKILVILSSFICVVTVVLTLLVNNYSSKKYDNEFVVSYMPNVMGVAVYEHVSGNTMKCNLTTVNLIIKNMIKDGFYTPVQDFSENNLLDITLSNGTDAHRILYNRRTRDFMALSSPFLKNYIPLTYVYE